MGPKVFVAVVALGGGCIGAPLLLWKENVYESSTQKSQPAKTSTRQAITAENKSKVTRDLPTVDKANAGRGNCAIQKMSDDSIDFLLKQEKGGKLYVELLCEKDNSDTESGSWSYIWIGLVPEALFADGFVLEVDKNFNLKTNTVTEGEQKKTTFRSNALKSPFDGIWGDKLQNRKGKTVTTISVPDSSNQEFKIYTLPD